MFMVRGCSFGAGDFFDRSSGHNRNTTAASSNRRGMDLGNDKDPVARRFFSFAVVRQVSFLLYGFAIYASASAIKRKEPIIRAPAG